MLVRVVADPCKDAHVWLAAMIDKPRRTTHVLAVHLQRRCGEPGVEESGSENLSSANRYTSFRLAMPDSARRLSASRLTMISPRYLSTNWPFRRATGQRTPQPCPPSEDLQRHFAATLHHPVGALQEHRQPV